MKKLICMVLLVNSLFGGENLYNDLFIKYGKISGINPQFLWGIAKTESDFDPRAINGNANGTVDIGLMQINSIHYSKIKSIGHELRDLFDPEVNIAFGAYVLMKCFKKHGYYTHAGLNCYNGKISNNPYSMKVLKNIIKAINESK